MAPSRKAAVYVVSTKKEITDIFNTDRLFFETLAYASEVTIQENKAGIADDAVSVVIADATLYMPFTDLVDISQEIDRLEKEEKRLEGELARSKGMLSNERFLSKAPKEKVDEERSKQEKYEQTMKQVRDRLTQLRK